MYKRWGTDIHKINFPAEDLMVIQVYIGVQVVLLLDTLCFSGDNINECYNFASIRKP